MATHEHTDIVVVVEETGEISLAELAELSGLNAESLQELALAGCLGTVRRAEAEWSFGSRSIVMARRARRLQTDFGLDEDALVLALTLLIRVEELEIRMRELECQVLR